MIEIIPAIDILEGRCVRLEQGDFRMKKVYEKDPLEAAKEFEDHGIRRLHVVDLDGAKAKRVINWKVIEKIAEKTSLIMDFGGGIKETKDLKIVYDCGAVMAVIGSAAVENKALFHKWLEEYGSQKLILAADVKDRKIAVSAWDDVTDIEIISFLEENLNAGVRQVLCTDISKDGMMQGPAVELYEEITDRFPDLKIIASGGISSVNDVNRLQDSGIPAVIIGKALYEGNIKLAELKKFL